MKAIVCTRYGSPNFLQLKEVEKPIPKDDEALIKIHYSTVTAGDCRIIRFDFAKWFWIPGRIMFGLTKPRKNIPGWELSGEIEAVGENVKQLKAGDKVFGFYNGISFGGTNAEYKCLSANRLISFDPDLITFEEAVALPVGGLTALYFLRQAKVGKGDHVLVYGASGSVGTYAVQLAKYFGAKVTGVCSTKNFELVRSLGADDLIDYKKEDFRKNKQIYDVIFDTVDKISFSYCRKSLSKNGIYLTVDWPFFLAVWTSLFCNKKVIIGMAPDKREDLVYLKKLVEEKKIKPVIDTIYPLDQAVAAYQYANQGHKCGNLVISVFQEAD